jgi:hypothetical protein
VDEVAATIKLAFREQPLLYHWVDQIAPTSPGYHGHPELFTEDVGRSLKRMLSAELSRLEKEVQILDEGRSRCVVLMKPGHPWMDVDFFPGGCDCLEWVRGTMETHASPEVMAASPRAGIELIRSFGEFSTDAATTEVARLIPHLRIGDVLVWSQTRDDGLQEYLHAARVMGFDEEHLFFVDKRGGGGNVFATNDIARISAYYAEADTISVIRPDSEARSLLFDQVLSEMEQYRSYLFAPL